ncbi:hypothetical protein FVE85_1593 [Porphyridium purpureum]|uniref:Glycosyltransferase family 92 protein n=1 Tax=Porphyridium purpureum TaxID=35688 RepID=A0A5J4YW76_PORPP|nr:hypothetical protein FVE85_1593 [Porphyridium purpureum]|eukprot:POR6145..scf209_3
MKVRWLIIVVSAVFAALALLQWTHVREHITVLGRSADIPLAGPEAHAQTRRPRTDSDVARAVASRSGEAGHVERREARKEPLSVDELARLDAEAQIQLDTRELPPRFLEQPPDTSIRIRATSNTSAEGPADTTCTSDQQLSEWGPFAEWNRGQHKLFVVETYLLRTASSPSDSADGLASKTEPVAVSPAFIIKYRGPFQASNHSWLNVGLPFELHLSEVSDEDRSRNNASVTSVIPCRIQPPPLQKGDPDNDFETWYSYRCGTVWLESSSQDVRLSARLALRDLQTLQLLARDFLVMMNADLTLCEWDERVGILPLPKKRVKFGLATLIKADFTPKLSFEEMDRTVRDRLAEWIAYNIYLGFEFISIYVDGECDASIRDLLRPFTLAGVAQCTSTYRVHVREDHEYMPRDRVKAWRDAIRHHQRTVFSMHVERYREYIQYMSFMDPDEFLVISQRVHSSESDWKTKPPLASLEDTWNAHYKNACSLRATWMYLEPTYNGTATLTPSSSSNVAPLLTEIYTTQRYKYARGRGNSKAIFIASDASSYVNQHGPFGFSSSTRIERDLKPKDGYIAHLRFPKNKRGMEFNLLPTPVLVEDLKLLNTQIRLVLEHFNDTFAAVQPQSLKASAGKDSLELLPSTSSSGAFLDPLQASDRGAGIELSVSHLVQNASTSYTFSADPFRFRDDLFHQTVINRTSIRVPFTSGSTGMMQTETPSMPCMSAREAAEMEPLMVWGEASEHQRAIFLLDMYLVRVQNDTRVRTGDMSVHFLIKYRGPFQDSPYSWLNQGLPFRVGLGVRGEESLACHIDPPPLGYDGEIEVMHETWFTYHCDSFSFAGEAGTSHVGVLVNASLFLSELDLAFLSMLEPTLWMTRTARNLSICEHASAESARFSHLSSEGMPNALVTMIAPEYQTNSQDSVRTQPSSLQRIPEWLAYHLDLGFDLITVYVDDGDLSEVARQLESFIQTQHVRLMPSFRNHVLSEVAPTWQRMSNVTGEVLRKRDHQRTVFSAHVDRYGLDHEVMMFLDVDEFLFINATGLVLNTGKSSKELAGHERALDWLIATYLPPPSPRAKIPCQVRLRWWHHEMNSTDPDAPLLQSITARYSLRRQAPWAAQRGTSKALFRTRLSTSYANQHGVYKFSTRRCTTHRYVNAARDGYIAHLRPSKQGPGALTRNALEAFDHSDFLRAVKRAAEHHGIRSNKTQNVQ